MKTYIISIGSELISGKTLNTNGTYIANRLDERDISVDSIISIDDNKEKLGEILKNVSRETSLIFLTGGLGSTDDDITKDCILSLASHKEIDFNSREKVIKRFEDKDYDMDKILEDHIKVYTFPRGAVIFDNKMGTANGFRWKYGKANIYVLPGPPREMKYIYDTYIDKDIVNNITNIGYVRTFNFLVVDYGEWKVSDILSAYEYGENISINTFYIDRGVIVRLRIRSGDLKEINDLKDGIFKDLKVLFPSKIYGYIDNLEEYLVNLLIKRGLYISTGESITGGLIASSIINISGSSSCIRESYVTYSNEIKNKVLKVPMDILERFGPVSEETASSMLKGVHDLTGSDICIVTTGFAGPSGDVGRVFIGLKVLDKEMIFEKKFSGDRNTIRKKVKDFSLFMAIRQLEEE